MAQSPFRSDAVRIEGDGPGTRLIECAVDDGSLLFTDPRVPAGVKLSSLAGLQQAQNTLVVTPSGIAASKDAFGAPITHIQQALDAVPSSSGPSNPWTILIAPGVYREDLMVIKDHVTLMGLGGVSLRELTAQSSVRILQGPGSVPQKVRLQNLRVENSTPGRACVDLSTSQFALGSITVAVNPNVGDSVTIAGVVLTAVAIGVVPAPGEFELGGTLTETAENLVTAITDPVNVLGVVLASFVGNVVSIRAMEPGTAGNAITLASSVPLILVISAPTLLGGLDASNNSAVGLTGIEIVGCDLVAAAVNGFQLRARAVNNIRVQGGSWEGSDTGSFLDVRDCSSLLVQGVAFPRRFEVHYDSAALNLPMLPVSEFVLRELRTDLPLNSSLTGGSLTVLNSQLGDVNVTGSSSFVFRASRLGNLLVQGLASLVLAECYRISLSGDPTAIVTESELIVDLNFAGTNVEAYTFSVPRVDASYTVVVENAVAPVSLTSIPYVANKTAQGFEIRFGTNQTTTVHLAVLAQV